jgi:MOSC domain-containing protein YiiM
MKVISTNIGSATTIHWKGREEQTGIFKFPVPGSLQLNTTHVENDTVSDRKNHSGIFKACYLFSADQYPYWKKLYPALDWDWGMFGENLTVSGMDETHMRIGDIYDIGTARVQVSQPRQPCYKLGIRFGDQKIIGQFVEHGYPGTYVRVLKEGKVQNGNKLSLVSQSENALTVRQFYTLLYARDKEPEIVQLALDNMALPEYKRKRLEKYRK